MLKKVIIICCIMTLMLSGCYKYPGDYVYYISVFGPNEVECNSFYHYKYADKGLNQSGLQRYDLITETDQDIYEASDPHNQIVSSYWGDDEEVYFVVLTYKKGDDEMTLYHYDLSSGNYETLLENEKSLRVYKDVNTNKIVLIRDFERYLIEDGKLKEIDKSDVIMSSFNNKTNVVRRVSTDGTLIEICKEYDNSEFTCTVNESSHSISALSNYGGKESGLTDFFVIEGDTIIGVFQITKGTRGLTTTNLIRERELKKELLVSINYKTGDSVILFNTKNNKTRIIGYSNGNIYLLKDSKIIRQNLSDNSEKEIYTLTYDGNKQLSFSWVGNRLIIFDEYYYQVIANIQT